MVSWRPEVVCVMALRQAVCAPPPTWPMCVCVWLWATLASISSDRLTHGPIPACHTATAPLFYGLLQGCCQWCNDPSSPSGQRSGLVPPEARGDDVTGSVLQQRARGLRCVWGCILRECIFIPRFVHVNVSAPGTEAMTQNSLVCRCVVASVLTEYWLSSHYPNVTEAFSEQDTQTQRSLHNNNNNNNWWYNLYVF